MKSFLLAFAAIPLAALSSTASAQPGYGSGYGAQPNGGYQQQDYRGDQRSMGDVRTRIQTLGQRIDAGVQAGEIDRMEARALRRQLRQLQQMETSYSAGGITSQERVSLMQGVRSLRDQLRTAYGRGYAYNDGEWDNGYAGGATTYATDQYGRPTAGGGVTYDRYGRPLVSGNVTYDRYGRPVTTGYASGNGYSGSNANSSGGIGGVLASILSGGGLRSGDVVTSAIGSALVRVPSNYSSRYRDEAGVYYRSDGERVYEIDARTNTVVRIYPMNR
jgi:hypothetical protein